MMTNTVQVGEVLYTWQQFRLLPVGTTIGSATSDNGAGWVKQDDNRWLVLGRGGDPMRAEGNFSLSHMKVTAYPEDYQPSQAPPLTLLQFQHRFRDWALAAQETYGVAYQPVEVALTQLGCGWDQFPPGPGMVLENTRDRAHLPAGTVGLVGEPENYAEFGLFVKQNYDEWNLLLGNVRHHEARPMVIESMPNGSEAAWLAYVGTEADQEEILRFRRRAWVVAEKVKQTSRWCPTFDHAVARMGISQAILVQGSVNGVRIGDIVDSTTARGLPLGTIFRYSGPSDRTVWYQRVDHRDPNRACTRRIFGYSETTTVFGHYNERMEVMWLPGGEVEMDLDVDIANAHPYLPIGTVGRYRENYYMLCQDRRFAACTVGESVRATGPWDLDTFIEHGYPFRVVSFGAPS